MRKAESARRAAIDILERLNRCRPPFQPGGYAQHIASLRADPDRGQGRPPGLDAVAQVLGAVRGDRRILESTLAELAAAERVLQHAREILEGSAQESARARHRNPPWPAAAP